MVNKPLKFRSSAIEAIESGESNITWRLYDDKDIAVGDILDLINRDTDSKFGEATVMEVREKKLSEVDDDDIDDSERYDSPEEMYAAFSEYYDEEVGPDTPVKIIRFQFMPEVASDDGEDMDEEEDLEEEFLDEE